MFSKHASEEKHRAEPQSWSYQATKGTKKSGYKGKEGMQVCWGDGVPSALGTGDGDVETVKLNEVGKGENDDENVSLPTLERLNGACERVLLAGSISSST